MNKYIMKILKYLIILCGVVILRTSHAGGFFEVGQVTLTDTIDNGGWVTIVPTKMYVNPVVIAGPITHNNDLSLFPRVDGLLIGMQSPCENQGGAAGTLVCPPAGGWLDETITYLIVEEGVWEFPDETELEADIHTTATVRSTFNNDDGDLITVQRTGFDSIPAILHTVNSFNDPEFISTTVFGTGSTASDVTTTQFTLALEGMEVVSTHGAEEIAWVAIEPAIGTNAGTSFNAGRTAGLDIDRHSDACTSLGHGNNVFVAQHNTMSGGNGSGVRRCDNADSVHMDEDQVGDTERTGIPERVSWFTYDAGEFGNLVFLTATQTVTDNNGGLAQPGDTLTYTVTITNELNDFTQADNPADEMTIQLPPNTTLVGGSLTQTSGLLSGTGPLAWNGSVDPGQSITLTYQVVIDSIVAVCNADLDNQATLHMDPNGDGLNTIDELSDDPTRNDGIDTDMDNGSDNLGLDDDDPTRVSVSCAALQLVKNVINDNGGSASVTGFNLSTDAGSLTFTSTPPVLNTTTYTSNQLIVPIGSYDLIEADFFGYTEGAWSCNGGTGLVSAFNAGSITLANGDDVICSISNDDVAPQLTIIKDPTNDNGGNADPDDFLLTVDGNSVLSGIANSYLANTPLAINETTLAGYTFVSITGDPECPAALGDSITLGVGDDITCTITNDDVAAQLTLLKAVNNSPGGGTAAAGDWTLEANLGGGAAEVSGTSGVSGSVNAGDYVLSENNGPSGYTQTNLSCDSGTLNVDTLSVGLGENITCTFTNRDLITDLQITKSVSDPNPSIGDIVTFTIDVYNDGPDDATNVVIDDTVLAGFSFIANSMTGGNTQNQTAPNLQWTIDPLPAGVANTVTLTYQATVN